MRIPLRTKYSFILICLVSTLLALLAFSSMRTYRESIASLRVAISADISQSLTSQLAKRAESITSLLAEQLINPMYFYDLNAIKNILKDTLNQHNVISTIVFSNDCQIIHEGSEIISNYQKIYTDKTHCLERSDTPVVTTTDKTTLTVSELVFLEGKKLGGISVQLSTEEVELKFRETELLFQEREREGLKNLYQQIFIISVFLIFLALILAIIIASRFVKPIDALRLHTQRIGRGDYQEPILLDRNDELGDLVKSFEQMRLDLSSSTVSIDHLRKEIAEKTEAEKQRKIMESQLHRAQRMEAIGQLAAGVAHDLNNILSGIVTLPQFLLLDLPEDSPLRTPLLTIQSSGNRAAAIVQDMLNIAKSSMNILEVVSPFEILNGYLKSPEYVKLLSTYPLITVNTDLDNNIMNIKGSPVHLVRVITNLVKNAAEAVPANGNITISLKNIYIDAPLELYDSLSEGDYVCLTVEDNGVGISEEDLPNVFEPFYTKKIMGRSGTGLGMAIIWNTVKIHDGYINIQSDNGKGTKIHIYFPVTREALPENEVDPYLDTARGNQERILVVDDIEEQRQIASAILTKLNYSVESVNSGEHAIAYVKDHSVDLIVLDMIMDPGIDGLETCKKILSDFPDIRILIVTGFSEGAKVQEALDLGAVTFIRKPYSVETLGFSVLKILN